MAAILVPASSIKSPGLLKQNLFSIGSAHIISQDHSTSPLAYVDDSNDLSSEVQDTTNEDFERLKYKTGSFQDYFDTHFYDRTSNPGKLKSLTEDVFNFIKKAKDVFSSNGIELVIDLPSKHIKDSYDILKSLLDEMPILPKSLVQKLDVRQIIICKNKQYDVSNQQNVFQIDNITNKDKTITKFYDIIFHSLLKNTSELAMEWMTVEIDRSEDNIRNPPMSLRAVFWATIKGSNHPLVKPKIEKFMEMLTKYYPGEITSDWFRNRNRQRRRSLRVQFEN